jgi:hypothetical protein
LFLLYRDVVILSCVLNVKAGRGFTQYEYYEKKRRKIYPAVTGEPDHIRTHIPEERVWRAYLLQ